MDVFIGDAKVMGSSPIWGSGSFFCFFLFFFSLGV